MNRKQVLKLVHRFGKDLPLTQNFVDRLVYDYDELGTLIQSTTIYNQLYHKYYPTYEEFIADIKQEISTEEYQAIPNTINEYLISYEGLQQLKLKHCRESREHFILLYHLLTQYMDLKWAYSIQKDKRFK